MSVSQRRIVRPWGWFETIGEGLGYLVKRLSIKVGQRISLQRHRHRSEHWVVVGGRGLLELDGQRIEAEPGQTLFIPVGALHRVSALAPLGQPSALADQQHGTLPTIQADADALVIIEVQRGDQLSETDIERIADDYGRVLT